jgi:hypothetical protein
MHPQTYCTIFALKELYITSTTAVTMLSSTNQTKAKQSKAVPLHAMVALGGRGM